MANEITSKPAARKAPARKTAARKPKVVKAAPAPAPRLSGADIAAIHHPMRSLVAGLHVPILGQARPAEGYAKLAKDAAAIAKAAKALAAALSPKART